MTAAMFRVLGEVLTTVRGRDRKGTRLNSSHVSISYAVFCLKKKKQLAQTGFARCWARRSRIDSDGPMIFASPSAGTFGLGGSWGTPSMMSKINVPLLTADIL